MKRTIYGCDVCGKECEQTELLTFRHTDALPDEITVDICKDCIDRITGKKPKNGAVKMCKFAEVEEKIIPSTGERFGREIRCLGTREKDPCPGFDECPRFKQEEW